ncbi:MAG: glycosyltransferase family 2 protein [bacterium]|nr:glycosyltransferase family 2 protein [bacterium]
MIPQCRQLYAIIVHYQNLAQTEQTICSLCRGSVVPDRIIVVDQNPTKKFQHKSDTCPVLVIRPQKNSGYAAGINLGLGAAYGGGIKPEDIVLCMNDDVSVLPDALERMMAWWKNNSVDALVGAAITESGQTIAAGGKINYLTGRTRFNTDTPARLDYIHGAFFAAPFRLFIAVKGLPENYFLYWEDVLFSRLVKQKGYPLKYLPQMKVTHHTLSCGDKSTTATYYLVRNGALFMQTHTPWPINWIWRCLNLARLLFHYSLQGSSNPVTKALKDAARGKTGPIKKLNEKLPN